MVGSGGGVWFVVCGVEEEEVKRKWKKEVGWIITFKLLSTASKIRFLSPTVF